MTRRRSPRILATIRRRAAFHSEDEARLKERMQAAARGRSFEPQRMARRRSGARLDRAAAAARRRTQASACMCCMSRPARRWRCSRCTRTSPSVEVTPQHLTLATPEAYESLGTRAQMNPPLRDRDHQRAAVVGARSGRGRCARLRSRAAHARGEEQELPGDALRHAGRADAGAGDARPRQCRTPEPRPLRRSDQRRPAAHLRHRRQGPHRRGLRRRPHHRRSQGRARHRQ